MAPGQRTYHNVFIAHTPGNYIIGAPYGDRNVRDGVLKAYPTWVKVLYRLNVRWK